MKRGKNYVDLRMFSHATKRYETALAICLKLVGDDVNEELLLDDKDYVKTMIDLGHVHYIVSSFDTK